MNYAELGHLADYLGTTVALLASNSGRLLTRASDRMEAIVKTPPTYRKSAALDHDATAAEVQTALEGITLIESGNVLVTGAAGGPYTVEFTGTHALRLMPTMVAFSALTGGTNPYVSVASVEPGDYDTNAEQTVTLKGVPTGGTFYLVFGRGAAGMMLATCAQVEFWNTAGEGHDILGVTGRVGLGSLQSDSPPILAPRAKAYLLQSGMLYQGVGMS